MTESVVEVLDSCEVIYRKSVEIIGVIASALGFDINELILNKTTFNEKRKKIREDKAKKKDLFMKKEEIGFEKDYGMVKLLSIKRVKKLKDCRY